MAQTHNSMLNEFMVKLFSVAYPLDPRVWDYYAATPVNVYANAINFKSDRWNLLEPAFKWDAVILLNEWVPV